MTDAPLAARRSTLRTHHGDTFDDPYEWMRAKDSEEVIAHLEAENAYTDAQTAHLAALRTKLFEEIKARVQETDLSVPTRRGDWWYYSRTEEGAVRYPLPRCCRRRRVDSARARAGRPCSG